MGKRKEGERGWKAHGRGEMGKKRIKGEEERRGKGKHRR